MDRLNRTTVAESRDERVALKDDHLVYRACSAGFARELGFDSPARVIGRTDFDLLPRAVARAQMALDSRVMQSGEADIGTIELVRGERVCQAMIVRTPVTTAAREICGIDIRLLGGADALVDTSGDPLSGHPSVMARAAKGLSGEGLPVEASNDRLRLLRVNEQRFRHYARSAADFFWELDANLVFRDVSDDIERVLGLPAERLIGKTHRQLRALLADESESTDWQDHLDALDRHERFRDVEFRRSIDGDTRVIRYSGLPLFDRERRFVGYRGVGCDVTTAVRQAEIITYHANHDALTGLVNRRQFEHRVSEALETSRNHREEHALCFMDLDNFKIVNDTGGHQAGDELLRQLARLLDSLVRKSDVLARLGGDEFGVFLGKCDAACALKLANQIRAEVEGFEFLWEGKRFTVGASVGLVVVDDRWDDIESLFAAADSACYIAKNEGRNRVVVYRDGEGNASNRRVATHWLEEIDAALADERMRIACQPVRALAGQAAGQAAGQGGGVYFEMLLRLALANGEIVCPRAFLPAAERHGLSATLDERAVRLTLDWLAARSPSARAVRYVSINLASGSFTDEGFAGRLTRLIQESGVAPTKLCFELSETAAIANLARASAFMQELSSIGCRFGIDDFGSGLSSFAWIRELPIDFLKIDGRLVRDIIDDPVDATTVRAISDICRSMKRRTVAQFVETPELLDAVRDLGIDFAQGFHIGKPVLIEARTSRLVH